MMALFSILIIVLAFLALWAFVEWITHVSMVKESCHTYGWTGFKKFRENFNKTEWVYEDNIGEGLFGIEGRHQKDRYFASVIKFDGVGMIINNPISFMLAKFYVQGYIQKNHSKEMKNKNYKW